MTTDHNESKAGKISKFSNMKVGTKVAAGSGVILLFLIAVATVSFFGLSGANTNFKQYRQYALQTNQLGRVQANLLTARLYAKDYILNNTSEAAGRVRKRIAATSSLIDEALALFERQDAVDAMTTAKKEIETYGQSFEAVTKLVDQRNMLVDTMNDLGPKAEKDLTAIMESAFQDNDATASFLAGIDLRSLLLARLYANRFLVDNLESSADRAKQELETFEMKAAEMLRELQNPTRRRLANQVLDTAKAYEVAFAEVIDVINERNGIIKGTLDVIGPKIADQTEQLKLENKALQDELGPRAAQEVSDAVFMAGLVSAIALVLGVLLAYFIGRAISKPVVNMTSTMRKLADGDLSVDIPALGQTDEIGLMADAVSTFKEAAIEKRRIQKEADETRNLTEQERADREAAKAVETANLNEAIEALANGLTKLSEGDLAANISKPFTGDLDRLRVNFNTSVEKLAQTLSEVKVNIGTIHTNSGEMRTAMENLSQRTEQQAAALEETSASLEELTATVKSSSERAQDATKKAAEAKASSDSSTQVVSDAVDAMSRIQNASGEIAKIIGVIDEIAFQTNLLALNAGVEAARAGEAGKGFAVVAQEVRELAQRSASAAKEIKDLISKSTDEVSGGVTLVKATGEALAQIAERVADINENISSIATAAQQQATGLDEINTAVSQMDQVTQHDAAMAEETMAVTQCLAEDANGLAGLVAQFNLGKSTAGGQVTKSAPKLAVANDADAAPGKESPAKSILKSVKQAFSGGRTEGNAAVAEDWKEF